MPCISETTLPARILSWPCRAGSGVGPGGREGRAVRGARGPLSTDTQRLRPQEPRESRTGWSCNQQPRAPASDRFSSPGRGFRVGSSPIASSGGRKEAPSTRHPVLSPLLRPGCQPAGEGTAARGRAGPSSLCSLGAQQALNSEPPHRRGSLGDIGQPRPPQPAGPSHQYADLCPSDDRGSGQG